jgi:hypothetical protein|tara:strand:+ start:854 stop:1084 length:231 start_codon:yes stop_codon:yes gene_type:complete
LADIEIPKDGKGQWHGGKGSARKDKDNSKYADNWDKIWGKKEDKKETSLTRREKVLLDPLEASQRSDTEKVDKKKK